jgi:TPP-dependent pyruvate/acetoin dehydrogenase alpha subunit
VERTVEEAVAFAEASPQPPISTIYDDIEAGAD